MQTLPTTCIAAMDAAGETGERVFGRREPVNATPENKDAAGLLPSSELTDEQIIRLAYQYLPTWDQDTIKFARALIAALPSPANTGEEST